MKQCVLKKIFIASLSWLCYFVAISSYIRDIQVLDLMVRVLKPVGVTSYQKWTFELQVFASNLCVVCFKGKM